MLQRLDATLAGIEAAVKRGEETGTVGTAQAERRAGELGVELERLGGLAEQLRSLAALEHSA